jgi:plasmid stabilization system protein ParE
VTLEVTFEIPAKADLAAAKLWLKDIRPGLDADFMICLEEAVERVRRYPESYPVISRELRRANLHRFPYSIYYRYEADNIRVFGVIHTSRHPESWHNRTR